MFFYQPLNEVYFGKTPELLAIEKQIGIARNSIANNKNVSRISMNSDPELLKLNDMIAEAFGFGLCALTIIDEPIMNAGTLPISCRFDVDRTGKALIVDKKGFKFDPKFMYTCIIVLYAGIFLNPKFTDAEVLSLILHEIGHNFYSSLSTRNGILSGLYTVTYGALTIADGLLREDISGSLLNMLYNTNTFKTFDETFTRKLRENNSILIKILDAVNWFKSLVRTGFGTAIVVVDMITLGTIKLGGSVKNLAGKLMNPLNYIVMPLRYSDERGADNFVTMYGYGGELASSLTKMEGFDASPSDLYRQYNKIPVIGLLYNTISLPSEIMASVLEEHPAGISRTQDQLDMLNRELNKADLDPRMKKSIKEDIKVCEAELDKLVDISGEFSDPKIAKHMYNRILYSLTGSKTLKDILLDDRKKFDRYDKAYFDKLQKSK